MGFGFMAVIIGYLPVLYQAFSRREQTISLLDARAGSPPTAGEMLGRIGEGRRAGGNRPPAPGMGKLVGRFVGESTLVSGARHFIGRNTITSRGWRGWRPILDTCALLLANILDINRHQVQITFAMARHATVDLALIFKTPPRDPPQDRLPDGCYRELMAGFSDVGIAGRYFRRKRRRDSKNCGTMYEPLSGGAGELFQFELPPIAVAEATPSTTGNAVPGRNERQGSARCRLPEPGRSFLIGASSCRTAIFVYDLIGRGPRPSDAQDLRQRAAFGAGGVLWGCAVAIGLVAVQNLAGGCDCGSKATRRGRRQSADWRSGDCFAT